VDIQAVLAELAHIMPGGSPVAVLVGNPQLVLNMEQAGLPSAIDLGSLLDD
jgi:hypothetical protein